LKMSSARQLKSASEVRPPSLPSNLPQKQTEEYVFNSIGFYGDLLTRLDSSIRETEELYKQSFYKVTSRQKHDGLNHFVKSDQKYQQI
jgi:hypothetical protein